MQHSWILEVVSDLATVASANRQENLACILKLAHSEIREELCGKALEEDKLTENVVPLEIINHQPKYEKGD